jgi:hypothetical protein
LEPKSGDFGYGKRAMKFSKRIDDELKKLNGFSSPHAKIVVVHGPDGVTLDVEFIAVDSMSCSFSEVRLRVPRLIGAEFDVIKEWAEALSKRITYLLENLGPLEFDPANKQVLMRSTPPGQQDDATQFYEVLLQAHNDGNFTLRRFEAKKPGSGRTRVPMQTTHEVLKKLVDDLVETIPPEKA